MSPDTTLSAVPLAFPNGLRPGGPADAVPTDELPEVILLGTPGAAFTGARDEAVRALRAGDLDAAGLLTRLAAARETATRTPRAAGLDGAALPADLFLAAPVTQALADVGALGPRTVSAEVEVALLLDDGVPAGTVPFTRALGPGTPLDYVPGFAAEDLAGGPAAQVLEATRAERPVPRPVVLGPVSLLARLVPADDAPAGFRVTDRLPDLLAAYGHLLADLWAAGAEWVQVDEPALVAPGGVDAATLALAAEVYTWVSAITERPRVLLALPGGTASRGVLEVLSGTGLDGVALDLVQGSLPDGEALAALGARTVVGAVAAGDGRPVDGDRAARIVTSLRALLAPGARLALATGAPDAAAGALSEAGLGERLRLLRRLVLL